MCVLFPIAVLSVAFRVVLTASWRASQTLFLLSFTLGKIALRAAAVEVTIDTRGAPCLMTKTRYRRRSFGRPNYHSSTNSGVARQIRVMDLTVSRLYYSTSIDSIIPLKSGSQRARDSSPTTTAAFFPVGFERRRPVPSLLHFCSDTVRATGSYFSCFTTLITTYLRGFDSYHARPSRKPSRFTRQGTTRPDRIASSRPDRLSSS